MQHSSDFQLGGRWPDGAAVMELSDTGNAQRFVSRHADEARYCHKSKQWLVWDQRRWVVDESGVAMQMTKDTAQSIYHEAANASDPEQAKNIGRHANRALSRERRVAMLDLAQSEPGIPISPDQLDLDPWLLNVENGTLDLRTGALRDHDRADLITKLAPVEYDSDAPCPTWDGFLGRITGDNRELVAYLQRCVGYSLTGVTSERAWFALHGDGRNGKTTFIETVHAMLGDDYAKAAPAEMLLAQRFGGGIPHDVAALKGFRFVSCSEVGEGRKLDEAKLKQLTGGDSVNARKLYGHSFTFRPMVKLWLATNHMPHIRSTDDGTWDRVRRIPFTVRIPEKDVDRDLPEKLKAELPGILAWAVRGCLDWRMQHLAEPGTVRGATTAYREEEDVVGAFLAEECVQVQAATVSFKELYAAYRTWCQAGGEFPVRDKDFNSRVRERGYPDGRSKHGKQWIGLRLGDGGASGVAGAADSGFSPSPFPAGPVFPIKGTPTTPTTPGLPDGLALVEQAA